MSLVIPIFVGSGEGGGGSLNFRGVGVVKKRESPDLRSPEVGISVSIHFNLLQFCPSVASVVSFTLF